MIEIKVYNSENRPAAQEKSEVIDFLFTHLEEYGDAKEDIGKAFDYTMNQPKTPGGFVVTAKTQEGMAAAAIINKTGMEGYIPENILVYIATHGERRGQGIATKLMNTIIETAEGNIALHVEHDNPAIHLYKKLGFTNKYLEMRLNKNELHHGIHNA